MIRIRYRWAGKCPRHPRYQPSRGPGTIKGGCESCHALWKVYLAALKLELAMSTFEEIEDLKGRLLEIRTCPKEISQTPG